MSNREANTSISKESLILSAGLAVGLLICLRLAWMPLQTTLSRFVFEDAFYYLRVAHSLVEGHGSSFDGIHPTNGYHPLWMLICMLLASAFPLSANMPVHILLSMCAGFHVLAALMIYKIVSLGGSRALAVVAALLWIFNYHVTGIAMCGLETSLFAFLVSVTAYFYTLRRRDLSIRQSVVCGILLGLVALSRLDGALLGFALAADQLYLFLRGREPARRFAERLVPMSLLGFAMIIPWMVWSYSVSGTIFPNSHRAQKVWIGSGGGFSFQDLFGVFHKYAPAIGNVYGFSPIIAIALPLFFVFCVALVWGREKRKVGLPIIVFGIYPLIHALYYGINFAPLNRYIYPAHLFAFAGMATVLGCWLLANRRRKLVRALGVATVISLIINMLVGGVSAWRDGIASVKTHSLHGTMYGEGVPWLKKHVGADERVGAFNCGIYAYFSGKTIVNLDGVMNDSVIPALEERRLIGYIREQEIKYVIDWEGQIDVALGGLGGVVDYRKEFDIVQSFEQKWGPYKGARLLVLKLKET